MLKTPLHDEYAAHNAKVVDFHGWALPVQFAGIIEEHQHVRTKAGLFDCSHMGEFVLEGAEAIAALDKLVFCDMVNLRVGLCRYGAILNAQGGVIDDCVGMKLSDEVLYLVTNAGPVDQVEALLAGTPGVRNVTAATTKIDLQGPLARDILLEVGFDIGDLAYWNGKQTTWQDTAVVVTRAGYTGEVGYELFVPNALGIALWRALVAHEDVMPCGLGARDTLRSEVGYPLNGEDLSESHTPLESAMTPLVKWQKEFIGKSALEAQRDAGNCPVLVAIKSQDRRAPRHGFEVKRDGVVVGTVTSGTYGPSVGSGVGLARVVPQAAQPGTALTAGPRDLAIEVADIPIYKDGTCRKKFS